MLSIAVYGLAIVISFVVATVIWGIVKALPLMQKRPTKVDTPQVAAPAVAAIPAEHVAAITAAVAAVTGTRHIIHIEDQARAALWTSEGRMMHQTSHAVPRGPKR